VKSYGYQPGELQLCDSWTKEVTASIPHRCDEWEIGDVDNLQAMINDLVAARKLLLANMPKEIA
jgi:hypothetical protein